MYDKVCLYSFFKAAYILRSCKLRFSRSYFWSRSCYIEELLVPLASSRMPSTIVPLSSARVMLEEAWNVIIWSEYAWVLITWWIALTVKARPHLKGTKENLKRIIRLQGIALLFSTLITSSWYVNIYFLLLRERRGV